MLKATEDGIGHVVTRSHFEKAEQEALYAVHSLPVKSHIKRNISSSTPYSVHLWFDEVGDGPCRKTR